MILSQSTLNTSDPSPRKRSGIRFLDPTKITIDECDLGLLHITIPGEEESDAEHYRGGFALVAFPISFPNHFITLSFVREDGRPEEIGIIEDPSQLSEKAYQLVQKSLCRNYFERRIESIKAVDFKYGLLFFEVDTEQGETAFQMLWRHDRTQDYGEEGKVLLDVHDNRFVIENVEALPKNERLLLTRYIYW